MANTEHPERTDQTMVDAAVQRERDPFYLSRQMHLFTLLSVATVVAMVFFIYTTVQTGRQLWQLKQDTGVDLTAASEPYPVSGYGFLPEARVMGSYTAADSGLDENSLHLVVAFDGQDGICRMASVLVLPELAEYDEITAALEDGSPIVTPIYGSLGDFTGDPALHDVYRATVDTLSLPEGAQVTALRLRFLSTDEAGLSAGPRRLFYAGIGCVVIAWVFILYCLYKRYDFKEKRQKLHVNP